MITDATLLVEVLSPSTENYDPRVQVRAVPAASFVHRLRETSDRNAVIPLPSIECHLAVAEAYERVNFESQGTGVIAG